MRALLDDPHIRRSFHDLAKQSPRTDADWPPYSAGMVDPTVLEQLLLETDEQVQKEPAGAPGREAWDDEHGTDVFKGLSPPGIRAGETVRFAHPGAPNATIHSNANSKQIANFLAELGSPTPILATEVAELVLTYLPSADDAAFDVAYRSFIAAMLGRVTIDTFAEDVDWPENVPVAALKGGLEVLGITEGQELWTCPHGMFVWSELGPPIEGAPKHINTFPRAYVGFVGAASDAARREILRSAGEAVSSVLVSIAYLQHPPCEIVTGNLPYLPETDASRLLPSCLEHYFFFDPRVKDSMQRRLSNAVRLLALADRQSDELVHLVLCFAAMESLVCRENEGEITASLSRRAAGLLEPELTRRHDAAAFVKKLYDSRSKFVHGRALIPGMEIHKRARWLASWLLAAVNERFCLNRRSGITKTPEKFFEDLDKDVFAGKQALVVTPPGWAPWRTDSPDQAAD